MENAGFDIALLVLNKDAMLQEIHQSYLEHSTLGQKGIAKTRDFIIVIPDGFIQLDLGNLKKIYLQL